MLGTCVLWVLGVNVVPALHLAFHHLLEPHHHGAAHHHEPGPSGESETPAPDAQDVPAPHDSKHGEGSLAHGDVAALVSPMTLPTIAVSRLSRVDTRVVPASSVRPRPSIYRKSARAPPV